MDFEIPTTEKELRAFEPPRLKTSAELAQFVDALVNREQDYGTCVYAVSIAAYAAYQFAARQLGITGFQAGCADFDVIRRTRHLDGPFMLVDGERALYPQYDLAKRLDEFLSEIGPWLGERAREKLATCNPDQVHSNVAAHWQKVAAANPPKAEASVS